MGWLEERLERLDPAKVRVHILALTPASLDEALDTVERPEDCERECFKHGGTLSCLCEEGDDGTWHDGC